MYLKNKIQNTFQKQQKYTIQITYNVFRHNYFNYLYFKYFTTLHKRVSNVRQNTDWYPL